MAMAGAAAVAIGVSAGPAAASTRTARAPNIVMGLKIPSATTSGWAAEQKFKPGDATAFTRVQDSFVLPTVTCDQTGNGIAAFGVSLGGGGDTDQSTAAQVYVRATCMPDGATPIYSTWYQLASALSGPGLAPSPGDTLHLKVTEKAGTYTMSILDITSKKVLISGSGACPSSTCENTSAEVTAGSPPMHPPANFGTVQFGKILVVGNDGKGGGMANAHWKTAKLTQTGAPAPHTASGPLHTLAHPLPHSAFADKWFS
jgi:hypothetical protein